MSRPIVNPGKLFWSGQHWINFIREPDAEINSAMVSLWYTHYCEAGEGSVAYVDIQDDPGISGIYTDNKDAVTFMQEWMKGRGGLYDKDLPIIEAQFRREGDIQNTPSWVIDAGGDRLVATWSQIQLPVILDAPAPKFREDRDVYSLLFFTDEASITLNERKIAGNPYPTDIWKKSIGDERSSCVFALSETFILINK